MKTALLHEGTAPQRSFTPRTRHAVDGGDRWREQIDRLRDERDEALERICQLEDLLVARDAALICDYGLSYHESQVVGALLRWPIITREQLMTLLYGCRADPPNPRSLCNLIWRVRRKLEPHGIVIHTMRGRGYMMEESSRARLKAAIRR